MASEKRKARRRYDAGLKAQILGECDAPGASVAKVAMTHGINANVVHRWRQLARKAGAAPTPVAPAFVPIALPAPAQAGRACDVRVELRRGATSVAITWPGTALCELAAFTRELLR